MLWYKAHMYSLSCNTTCASYDFFDQVFLAILFGDKRSQTNKVRRDLYLHKYAYKALFLLFFQGTKLFQKGGLMLGQRSYKSSSVSLRMA